VAGADHTLQDTIIAAWQTADRTTAFLLERLPSDLWRAPLPGTPRRTIQMLAGHLQNARCMWLRTLGVPQGLGSVRAVDRRTVTRRALLRALRSSGRGSWTCLSWDVITEAGFPPLPLTGGATCHWMWDTFLPISWRMRRITAGRLSSRPGSWTCDSRPA
jgi:hypothetical protein